MTFDTFQMANDIRNREVFAEETWTPQDWALSICGEAGELANLLKKVRRGDLSLAVARQDVLREVADVVSYCACLCTCLGANMGEILASKWNEVSERHKYDVRI